jgi:hypothetical protein
MFGCLFLICCCKQPSLGSAFNCAQNQYVFIVQSVTVWSHVFTARCRNRKILILCTQYMKSQHCVLTYLLTYFMEQSPS